MATVALKTLMTADELWQMPNDGSRYELVAGELIQMPLSGFLHGTVASNLDRLIGTHTRAYDLGVTCAAETGFRLRQNPDTIRAPDAAFITKERVIAQGGTEKYWPGAPDLAVEVVSPSDRFDEVVEKVQEWLAAGTRLVWVALPRTKTIMVYRSNGQVQVLQEDDELNGENVLPGFVCRVKEIFV